jgi:KUP system potassium uptake protein
MMLVTLGVVYGDIGTSPMYVMKAIVNGNGGINSVTEELILGALSLVIWTITLVTTVKYVVVAMRADNHGEGGIFALYSLVRRVARWLIIPAMIGGAALLADGILTPAVTATIAPCWAATTPTWTSSRPTWNASARPRRSRRPMTSLAATPPSSRLSSPDLTRRSSQNAPPRQSEPPA